MRITAGLIFLALANCTFGGTGIAPSGPSPAARAISEDRLDVPYVPTPREVVAAMLDMAAVGPGDYVIDLGSGDGRIAIMAAQRGARALGVDIDPARVAEASIATQMARVDTRALFRRQDLFLTPLRDASVVTMYLLPDVNMRLRPRLLTELRPGTRIVSHNFNLGDWRPDEVREVHASRVYFWRVPAVVAGVWRLELSDGTSMTVAFDQRFQEAIGTLDGRPLAAVSLSGTRLRFSDGARTWLGIVGEREIRPDETASSATERGWIARRMD